MTASHVSTLNSMEEEFRACFLKCEDPRALMAKHGVDFAVVEKLLDEVIQERAAEKEHKEAARKRADQNYASIIETRDRNKAEMKRLQDAQDLAWVHNKNVGKAIEALGQLQS